MLGEGLDLGAIWHGRVVRRLSQRNPADQGPSGDRRPGSLPDLVVGARVYEAELAWRAAGDRRTAHDEQVVGGKGRIRKHVGVEVGNVVRKRAVAKQDLTAAQVLRVLGVGAAKEVSGPVKRALGDQHRSLAGETVPDVLQLDVLGAGRKPDVLVDDKGGVQDQPACQRGDHPAPDGVRRSLDQDDGPSEAGSEQGRRVDRHALAGDPGRADDVHDCEGGRSPERIAGEQRLAVPDRRIRRIDRQRSHHGRDDGHLRLVGRDLHGSRSRARCPRRAGC